MFIFVSQTIIKIITKYITLTVGAKLILGEQTMGLEQGEKQRTNFLECMHGKSLQSCPTLCDPMDCSPPGSSVQGSLQARILEWVAMLSSRGIFQASLALLRKPDLPLGGSMVSWEKAGSFG